MLVVLNNDDDDSECNDDDDFKNNYNYNNILTLIRMLRHAKEFQNK